jgi:RHS repeat-associated protein
MKKIFLLTLFLISIQTFSQRNVIIANPDDPIEVTPVDPDPIDPSPVTTLSPPIETGEVGYTNGELSVSGTGGALYSIPIALPPGINNVAPNISLNYNSQSGDGYAGYGWNIGGVSKITIIPSTIYHDGVVDPVDYDALDRFALDGQRLILKTGVYGQVGSTYETENYSNLTVSLLGFLGFSYFKVEYSDGSFAVFSKSGNTDYSIEYWKNPQGITINYEYYPTDFLLEDVRLIKSISYGGINATPVNKIEFLYKDKVRQDAYFRQATLSITERKRNKVLSSIKVTGNGVSYRNYYLTHDLTSTRYERLKSIQEKTGDNTKSLKPIIFSYKNNQTSFNQQISYSQRGDKFLSSLQGDFTGASEIEALSSYNFENLNQDYTISRLRPNNYNDPQLDPNYYWPFPITFLDTDLSISNKLGYCHDDRSNQKFIFYSYDKINNIIKYEYEKVTGLLYGNPGDQGSSFYSYSDGSYSQRSTAGFFSDFNGDKLSDLVTMKIIDGSLKIKFVNLDRRLTNNYIHETPPISVGTSTFVSSSTNPHHSGTTKILQSDYDGDGKMDLIIFRGNPYNKIEIYSLVNNIFTKSFEVNYNLPGNIYDNSKFPIVFGDFNGDNRVDLLFLWDRKIINLIGYNLIKTESLPTTFILPDSTKRETFITWDLNNDGLDDIVRLEAIYESTKFRKCPDCNELWWIKSGMKINYYEKSTGQWVRKDFEQITRDEINNSIPQNINNITFRGSKPIFFTEKFGNSFQTMLAISGTTERYAAAHEYNGAVGYFNFFRHINHQTLLTRVDQGNGIVHEITYNNLMNGNGTYTSTTSQEAYPYYNLLNGKENKVVSEIRQVSSFTKKKKYKYHGAIFDLSGRGISGFQATTVTNWFNDPSNIISTVNKFDFTKNGAIKETFSKVGLIEPNYILLPSDTFIARSINTYNHEDTGYVNPLLSNKVFKLFKTKTENFNGQNNTSSITTVNYNTYNNPINSTTVIKNGGTVEKTTTNTFGYDGVLTSPYMVDRLNNKVSTTTLAATGDVHSSEEQYIYDLNLLKQIKKRSTNSGLTSDFITESNEYDAYGNVIQKKYSAPGMADRVVNYEYDAATHRFLVKKIDPELQETVYTYNQSTGLLLTETLPSNAGFPLITTYTYDLWGKVISIKDYLNKFVSYNYFNISGGGILKTTTGSDGSGSKIIYDPLGRTLHEAYKNLNEQWSVKSTEYNIYDQPVKVYKNYLDGNTPEVWDELQYDVYGRLTQANHLKSISSAGKTVTYTYNGLTTTENDGLKIKTTINNASGQVISLNDNPGETITYDYFANGNLRKAYLNGGVLEIQQDAFGRRKTLIDPSAGTRNYDYNKFGELIREEVVGKGETEFDLDDNGKLSQKRIKELGVLKSRETYTYNSNKQLETILFEDLANSTQINYTYTYDDYKRLLTNVEDATQYYFKQELRYDAFGRTEKQLYHAKNNADNKISNQWVKYEYKFGNKYKVYDMINESTQGIVLWEAKNVDKDGNVILGDLNNGSLNVERTFDLYGFPTQLKYSKGRVNLATLDTEFDPIYGNLTKRTSNLFGSSWTENLSYDALDRLTTWKDHQGIQNQTYNDNGTIDANKIGNYAYTISNKPFQVSTVTPVVPSAIFDYYANREQNITYNVNKKPLTIKELTAENIDFEYNGFDSRSVMYYGGLQLLKTDRPFRKYYASDGSMEIKRNVTPGGAVEFYTYIGGSPYSSSIVLKSNGTTKEYLYLLKDYQETINAIVNQSGTVIEKRQFDVWGTLIQYANASGITAIPTTANGLLLDRGYTSHEHLLGVNIINMNGRVYDHHLHKFLQPDNNIQDFYNTQNYNRYGYVMNNPTKYTDESGEFWWVIGALFNSYAAGYQSSGDLNPFNWGNTDWTNASLGFASSAASYGATYYADNYISNYGNNDINFEEDTQNTVSTNQIEEHSYVDDYSWKNLKYGYLSFMNRADRAADEWGQSAGQFIAGFHPGIGLWNAYEGWTNGKNIYGDELGKGGATFEGAMAFAPFLKVGKVFGLADDAAKTGLTNPQLVQKSATMAERAIGGFGGVAGTAKHQYASKLLNRYQSIYGNRGLETGLYFNNGVGNRGFLDVIDHTNGIIYDFKFGNAIMSPAQYSKYFNNFGLPIEIIRP